MLIPAITNAEFICKSIWPDNKYPQYPTFYRCRNITDINEESNDIKAFFNL